MTSTDRQSLNGLLPGRRWCCHAAAHRVKPGWRLPVWAMRTTSEWEESSTLTSLMLMMMSPTWRPEISAGVAGSMADTTTGRDPWMRNPNSPDSLRTRTISSHSSVIITIILHRINPNSTTGYFILMKK